MTQSTTTKPLSSLEKQALLKRIIETRKARAEPEPPDAVKSTVGGPPSR